MNGAPDVNAIAEAAVSETATEEIPKVEPDAEEEDPKPRIVTRKRQREGDADEPGTSSVRAWFRGSGERTRKSSRPSKKSY